MGFEDGRPLGRGTDAEAAEYKKELLETRKRKSQS